MNDKRQQARSARALHAGDTLERLRERAEREPLGVDISDYSDEFCAGFLAGQANALDFGFLDIAEAAQTVNPCPFCGMEPLDMTARRWKAQK